MINNLKHNILTTITENPTKILASKSKKYIDRRKIQILLA